MRLSREFLCHNWRDEPTHVFYDIFKWFFVVYRQSFERRLKLHFYKQILIIKCTHPYPLNGKKFKLEWVAEEYGENQFGNPHGPNSGVTIDRP